MGAAGISLQGLLGVLGYKMTGLTSSRADVVRTLIGAAPDSAIQSLDAALRGEAPGGSLSSVKTMVFEELRDRQVRDAVFGPLIPLFAPRADGFDQLEFPRAALTRMWRALKATYPAEAAAAAAAMPLRRHEDEPVPPIYDELCLLSAQALRAEQGDFAAVADVTRRFRAGAEVELAACLDLARLAREVLRQLPAWLARMTEERQASVRIAFKDAVAVAEDSGPRMMEILFAHLSEPWTILRIVSAVMHQAGDRFISGSELADFGERLLRAIDRRAVFIKAFKYEDGGAAGRQAADGLRIAAAVAGEFQQSLTLSREGLWADRLAKQKQSMAASAEMHLKKLEKLVGAALPMQPVRINGRTVRAEPKLDNPPDPAAVRCAQAALAFFACIRTVAAQSGYGTMRAKVRDEVSYSLDTYLEELLSILHSGDSQHMDNARLFLDVAADFIGLVHDDQAAQIVRRRAAAA